MNGIHEIWFDVNKDNDIVFYKQAISGRVVQNYLVESLIINSGEYSNKSFVDNDLPTVLEQLLPPKQLSYHEIEQKTGLKHFSPVIYDSKYDNVYTDGKRKLNLVIYKNSDVCAIKDEETGIESEFAVGDNIRDSIKNFSDGCDFVKKLKKLIAVNGENPEIDILNDKIKASKNDTEKARLQKIYDVAVEYSLKRIKDLKDSQLYSAESDDISKSLLMLLLKMVK